MASSDLSLLGTLAPNLSTCKGAQAKRNLPHDRDVQEGATVVFYAIMSIHISCLSISSPN